MVKRKREDDDYIDFCSGLQKASSDGIGNTSYVYSKSRTFKRPKINPNFQKAAEVCYRYVKSHEAIYRRIKNIINNNKFVIEEILEVKNDTLQEAFYKKKKEKLAEYGRNLQEIYAFHGTKDCNVDSICKFNFDWRLNGYNKGHKFGKGVCFSRSAKYASNYSDRNSYTKILIVAKVLIARICKGHNDMSIPPPGYDTSQKGNNGAVLVKYEDNEFFPAYVVQYHFRENSPIRNNYHYANYNYAHQYERNYNKYNQNQYYNYEYNQDIYYTQNDCYNQLVNYIQDYIYMQQPLHDFSIDGNYYNNENFYSF